MPKYFETDTQKLGKKVTGFPGSSDKMGEWQGKYLWNPGSKSWYEKPVSSAIQDIVPGMTLKEGDFGMLDGKKYQRTGDQWKLTDPGMLRDYKGPEDPGMLKESKEFSEDSSYKKLLLDAITSYLSTVGKQESLKDVYAEESERLGIPGKQKIATGIQQQVLDVEGLLDKLEGDIKERTIGTGEVVTESQRRRWEATEGAPLREQMADLMRAETRATAGLGGARAELATIMGLEEKERAGAKTKLEMMPLFKEALTYENPEEAFSRFLEEEDAKKKAGISPYQVKTTDWKEFSSQEKRKLEAAGIDWTTPEGRAKATEHLYGKEEKTFLTSSDYRDLSVKGVPKEVADAIAIALTEGQTLNAIRTGLAAVYGRDTGFGYLDIMIPYLQEKAKGGGGPAGWD